MVHFKSFVAGFISTIVFHQAVLWVLAHDNPAIPVWDLSPVPPFGVPRVISLSFWGGVWGIVLWQVIKTARGGMYWTRAAVIGALAPTIVSLLIVAPLKGKGMGYGWDPKFIIGALIVNAVWGVGVAVLMRVMNRAKI